MALRSHGFEITYVNQLIHLADSKALERVKDMYYVRKILPKEVISELGFEIKIV